MINKKKQSIDREFYVAISSRINLTLLVWGSSGLHLSGNQPILVEKSSFPHMLLIITKISCNF